MSFNQNDDKKANNYKTTEIIAITKVGTKSAIHTTIMERTGATYSLIMESTGRVEDGEDGGKNSPAFSGFQMATDF